MVIEPIRAGTKDSNVLIKQLKLCNITTQPTKLTITDTKKEWLTFKIVQKIPMKEPKLVDWLNQIDGKQILNLKRKNKH